MIIKLVHKLEYFPIDRQTPVRDGEHNRIVRQTQVFEGVTHYEILHATTEIDLVDYMLNFNFKLNGIDQEMIGFNLMAYDEVYVMNDLGKTIDTIRSVSCGKAQ